LHDSPVHNYQARTEFYQIAKVNIESEVFTSSNFKLDLNLLTNFTKQTIAGENLVMSSQECMIGACGSVWIGFGTDTQTVSGE
jgi:response regulator RpfG family c-di-GMP phosphodiesterase